MFVRSAVIWAMLVGMSATVARAADVRFTVSSRETFVGVPIQVEVIIENADEHDPPEFPEIDGADVRYLGPSTQQFTSITARGRVVRSTVTHVYSVVPQRAGVIVIPSIAVSADGASTTTEPTEIEVKKSDTGDLLFVEISGDRESVYVGEPIDVTLEIWLKPFASPNVQLSENEMWRTVDRQRSSWGPFIENFQGRSVDATFRTDHRDGVDGTRHRYFVYALKRRVWPERPGTFVADDIRVVVQYPLSVRRNRFTLLGGRYEIAESRPVSRGLERSPIVVKAPPSEGQPAAYAGAVGRFQITASAAPVEVSVGDPITVTLSIKGTGRLELLRAPRLAAQESLTADFRVPDEELPGEVAGVIKKFSQSIRAKHDRVTEIPPIEFSYFDPGAERYVTLKSNPIPITVKESSRLAVSEIIEGGGLPGAPTELTLVESGLLANYDDLDRLLTQQSTAVGRGTWGVVASGPILFGACSLIQRRRDRVAGDSGFTRRRSARRNALSAINRATGDANESSAAGEILSAVTGYVADRCNLPVGGVTRVDVVNSLRVGGVPDELVGEVDGLLGDCEGTQYGALDGRSVPDLIERARRCINGLEPRKF